ncbi:GNAT family protein [Dactylosporangium vinaceum]|uniref:GNAT family N-acetyltransferase n=1 Tax=Dactylosporangium vinaceum TaxID=53362 RepID=A0ABV5MH50_9ACTN|nr:GNAT family protein [Dactylosporangium vinaceum]
MNSAEVDIPDVRLRPVSAADFWLLELQADDPEAGGQFNWSGYRDIAATRRRFEESRLIEPDRGQLIVQVGGAVAGTVQWGRHAYGVPHWSCWNIGIGLLAPYRGRGVGTIAQRMLTAYLFDTTAVERVEAYTDVENVAEQRALEKAGFTREGRIRSAQFREGRWRDLYLYSLIRDEFKAAALP